MTIGSTYTLSQWPGEVIGFNAKLVIEVCPTCHITHGIPEEMKKRALTFNKAQYPTNYAKVYCPNGHEWFYVGKTDEQKANDRLTRRLESVEGEADRLREQRDHAKRQASARKGQLTKMRNRFVAGICPVAGCRANMGDRVRDHIANQHPEFRMDDLEPATEPA